MKKEIYNLLTKSVDDWEIDVYNATHKTGLKYWIANNLLFFHTVSDSKLKIKLGIFYTIKLWFWLKKANKEKAFNLIKKTVT